MIGAEKALARTVILRAFLDATAETFARGRGGSVPGKLDHNEAREWLRGKSKDFVFICNMADVEPEYVVRRYDEIVKNGLIDELREYHLSKKKTERNPLFFGS